MSRLKEIEKEQIKLKAEISQNHKSTSDESTFSPYMMQDVVQTQRENKNKFLEAEIERLETERRHILDRRESWLPKGIWNIVVPICISIVTVYLLRYLGFN